MDVSVVVPVYNGERFLVPCMESLLKQTLRSMEIIAVDDRSTDASGEMLRVIESQFPDKLKVITADKNRGAGGARNLGLQYAEGTYIGFVDCDDVVAPTMFEKLYQKAVSEEYDIVDCGFYNEAADQGILFTGDELTGTLTNEKRSELIVAGGFLWSKIFKRSFWMEQKFCFRENVILEDSEIIAKAMATATSIGNVKEILYCYKNAPESLSKVSRPDTYYQSCRDAMRAIHGRLSVLPNYADIRNAVEYEMLQMYSYAINMLLLAKKENMMTDIHKELLELSDFRKFAITSGYQNPYVCAKMDREDIRIMELNDTDSLALSKLL